MRTGPGRLGGVISVCAVIALAGTAGATGAATRAAPAPALATQPAGHLKVLPRLDAVNGQPRPDTLGYGTPGNLVYHGGRVLLKPRVYLIFWGWQNTSDPVAQRLISFFAGAGGSSWAGVTTQYWQGQVTAPKHVTNPRQILAGVWFDGAPIHDNLSTSEIAGEAARGAAHFGVDNQALYMVATPANANDAGFNQGDYCAWHSYTSPGIAYANQPYLPNAGAGCGAYLVNSGAVGQYDGVTMAAGHEYLEAVTDPVTTIGHGGWYDATGQENADKCAYVTNGKGVVHNVTWSTGTFAVQSTWSNKTQQHTGACAG